MRSISSGFEVGDHLFTWGTTAAEAASTLAVKGRGSSWQWIEAPCPHAFGVATISVVLGTPGTDRPVTSVSYELAPPAGHAPCDPTFWTAHLVSAFGAAHEAKTRDIPAGADASGYVRFHAHWNLGEHSAGLSIYGGLRKVPHGRSAGTLYLTWSAAAAARPFLAALRERSEALSRQAAAATSLMVFPLAHNQYPRFSGSEADRLGQYALATPELLPTPPCVAARLSPMAFALWRSEDHWALSTCWDSVSFLDGTAVPVIWEEMLPAKGGGRSALSVFGWGVTDIYGSAQIRAAADVLAAIPGVRVTRSQSYDC